MAPLRVVYSVTRYWRCYILLLVASILSFFLIYISKNDPNLEYYFPYFRLGSNYYSYYASGGAVKIKQLMEENYLDYEFLYSNSKYCLQKSKDHIIDEDYELFNDDNDNIKFENRKYSLDSILLIIGQASNFKHRTATRMTWAKQIENFNTKLIFIVGNPFYQGKGSKQSFTNLNEEIEQEKHNHFSKEDKLKLNKEIKEFNDIIQINMPDHDNYTSTKTLISIRWALTYCSSAKNVFVLSDSAVLNLNMFKNLTKLNFNLNDTSIIGQCNYTDEKFATALKLFFADLYSKKNGNKSTKLSKKNDTARLTREKNQLKSNDNYKGIYCSNLGWVVSMNGAKRLWTTALRSAFMMKISPAYLSGYLAFKSNLKHLNMLNYQDTIPFTNCLNIFQQNPNVLLCAENFTISSRFSSYIAAWKSPVQGPLALSKL